MLCYFMFSINPQILNGPWNKGYALDLLTVINVKTGKNERSEIGEASFLLKFKNRYELVKPITLTIKNLLKNEFRDNCKIDCLVSVPPSNLDREMQPVFKIVEELSELTGINSSETLVSKIKITPEIKDLDDSVRHETIKGVFKINENELRKYKTILIIDDLYSSGATAAELVNVIKEKNNNIVIYLITLIKSDSACMRTLG